MASKEKKEVLTDEGKELKRIHGLFVINPEGKQLLENWIKEYVHVRNPSADPVVEGKRIFVLDLLEDTLQDIGSYYEEKED